ncbi:hypothetical protein M422DRAFT_32338 [Sphaerobolus stellatus SS14]|uniref:Ubiquitin-like domain-containing protein n=1 Tax=Sphaerobolus stellatus (strain SS14) TaxID=990650 RepID=A0A0C9VQW4_SPHS4|nr:hypothetical protein M422DRAFT_32338 [Sphaerobolus stellatus SS14]
MTVDAEVEDVKPKLNLTVVFGENSMKIQVKPNTPFKKVFEATYKRFNLAPGSIRFGYEGSRIQPDDTPFSLGVEDDDQIDAQAEQVGGGCS